VDWYIYPRSQAAWVYIPEAVPAEYLAILRRLLVQYRDDAPEEMLAPVSRYLDLAEAVL